MRQTRDISETGRRRHNIRRLVGCLVLPALLMAVIAVRVDAQSHPNLAARTAIVNALNAAVTAHDTVLSLSPTELFDAVDGACGTVEPLSFEIIYGSGTLTLRRKLREGDSLGLPTSHPLVEDLNAWLNAVWAMDLNGVPEFDSLGWACSNPGQRYYTRATTDSLAVAYVKEASGENRILSRYYTIGGARYRGSSFLSFSADSVRRVKYVTDLGPGGDTGRVRFLSKAYLSVTCPGDTAPALVFYFDIETEQYSGDCGIPRESPVNLIISFNDHGETSECRVVAPDTADTNVRNRFVRDTALYFRNKWDEPRDSVEYSSFVGFFTQNETGTMEFIRNHGVICGPDTFLVCTISTELEQSDEYCEATYCEGGTFGLDAYGRVMYTFPAEGCGDAASCGSVPLPCLIFCDSAGPAVISETQAIRADARTFTDRSPVLPASVFEAPPVLYGAPNDFEIGKRGKWRPVREYAYRAAVKPGSGLFSDNPSYTSERNYNDAGVFTLDLFRWRDTNDVAKWLNGARTTLYSQNGEPAEEEDIFGIPSAARFGYRQQVPVLIVKNGRYGACLFQSFEADVPDTSAANGAVVTTYAHAGRASYLVPHGAWSDPIETAYTLTSADTILVRLWARHTYESATADTMKTSPLQLRLAATADTVAISGAQLKRTAKTGDWALFETSVVVPAGTYGVETSAAISGDSIWLDDLRLQPATAEMVCHVYDPATLRPVASFDEAHFGMYYQYNGEGKLTRKIRETMRGFRTVQEAQYHTPQIDRAYASSAVSGTVSGDPPDRSSRAAHAVMGEAIAPRPMSGNLALLDAEFGLNRRKAEILGVDPDRLGERIDELRRLLRAPALEPIGLPDAGKLALLAELERADTALLRLQGADTAGMNEAERAAHRDATARAAEARRRMLQRLGIDEATARELIDGVRALRRTGERNEE